MNSGFAPTTSRNCIFLLIFLSRGSLSSTSIPLLPSNFSTRTRGEQDSTNRICCSRLRPGGRRNRTSGPPAKFAYNCPLWTRNFRPTYSKLYVTQTTDREPNAITREAQDIARAAMPEPFLVFSHRTTTSVARTVTAIGLLEGFFFQILISLSVGKLLSSDTDRPLASRGNQAVSVASGRRISGPRYDGW